MGDTWYDSLQIKVTKRYSHGLTAQVAYTLSKSLTNAANSNTSYLTPNDPVLNDPYNTADHQAALRLRSAAGAGDLVQLHHPESRQDFLGGNGFGKAASWLARDWTIGGVLKYASGQLIQSPASNITLWNTMGIGGTPLNGVSNFSGGGQYRTARELCSRPVLPGRQSEQPFRPDQNAGTESECLVEPVHGNVWRRGALLQQLPVAAPAGRISQLGPDFPREREAPVVDPGAVLQCIQSCVLSCAGWGNHQHHGRHVQQPVPGLRCCDRGVERRLRVCEHS